MEGEVDIRSERVDDIPFLIHQIFAVGIPEVVDDIASPHGNRKGVSYGALLGVWLAYILSEADHRMWCVEKWVETRLETLRMILRAHVQSEPVVKDFTDDRLADGLRLLSDDETWRQIETRLSERVVRVYDLKQARVRLDATTVSVYKEPSVDGLFRLGHSKRHRPDLAQLKLMMATLDPLGLPIAAIIVPGNSSDDVLYIPAIDRVKTSVGTSQQIFVGDCKMSALATRAHVFANADKYVCPLPKNVAVSELLWNLSQEVARKERRVETCYDSEGESQDPASRRRKVRALGFEFFRDQESTLDDAGNMVQWCERVVAIYTPWLAQSQRQAFYRRLDKAVNALQKLAPEPGRGRKSWPAKAPLQKAVKKLLRDHDCEDFLHVEYVKKERDREIGRGQNGKATTKREQWYELEVTRRAIAVKYARRPMGWRLYVTNTSSGELPWYELYDLYCASNRIERDFRRLKHKPLGLAPLHVQREDHAKGLVRLLVLGILILTLTEHVARRTLESAGETLSGIYPGNPKRATKRPTTEAMLYTFRGITLTIVKTADQTIRHITPLDATQKNILRLLHFDNSLYDILPFATGPPFR